MFPDKLLVAAVMLVAASLAYAQLDQAKLAEAYKQWDLIKNGGQGLSASPDSGTLGWGEAGYLRAYSDLWLVTSDPYWLGKIEDHFTRIMGTATDPDGDGFLGWQTATYSAPVYWCQPLCNRGTAIIEPSFYRELSLKAGTPFPGHNYVISFVDEQSYTVQDQNTRQPVGEKQAYKDGAVITEIPGCKVKVSGAVMAGDKFMVRTLPAEPTEFVVHEGMIAYPVAVFIEAVAKDPKLRATFGASADAFLAFMNRHLLQKHEQHWLDLGNGMGGYRFVDLITDRYPNRLMPHNQYLALARAFLVLKDVPGADPLMGQRTEQMARLFRANLIAKDQAWTWHYWDWFEAGQPGSSGFEDTSHGTIDVGFAIDAALRGVVFTDDDMKRFGRTVLDLMWNGSETNPKLGPNCATKGEEFGMDTSDWVNLCHWEPRIYELALKNFKPTPTNPTRNPAMLRAESLCAK